MVERRSMAGLFALFAVVLVPTVVTMVAVFDRLLVRMHREHFEEWTNWGRPVVFSLFWQGFEQFSLSGFFERWLAGIRSPVYMFLWSVWTPTWARDDMNARNLLVVIRVCMILAIALGHFVLLPAMQAASDH
jgi:hypothetical protein